MAQGMPAVNFPGMANRAPGRMRLLYYQELSKFPCSTQKMRVREAGPNAYHLMGFP
jgi:hypothetical protein